MLCDRAYPGDDMLQLLKSKNRDLFAGVQAAKHFDALGMSLAYEPARERAEMMHLSGLPLTHKARTTNPTRWNVTRIGLWSLSGPTATSNRSPSPISSISSRWRRRGRHGGAGECLKKTKAEGLTREETLYRLATEVEGITRPAYDSPKGWGGAVFPTREGVPERCKRRVADPDPLLQVGLVPYVPKYLNTNPKYPK